MRTIALFFGAALAGSAAAQILPPSDPSFFFSPYQWLVNGSSATTLNTGSYFRLMFTGNFVNLTFDVSLMVAPPSQLYYKLDNQGAVHFTVAALVPISVPANLTHGDVPYHFLEVFVKSMTERANRWAAGVPSTRVVFTGLALEAGAKVTQPVPQAMNILIYGDSITEGVLTLGGSQPFDTDHNDASIVYSYRLAQLLGGEIGVIGFGATGLSRGGSGGVPALGVSWNQLWDGVPRACCGACASPPRARGGASMWRLPSV